jgi:hypothetical protein
VTEEHARPLSEMLPSLKKAAAALRDGGVPYILAGGIAAWAYGGPESDHDVDFIVKPEDADRALAVLADAGFHPEKPPEEWLYKAWDEDILIDIIFGPSGLEVTDELIGLAERREVQAMTMPVMRPQDILVTKLMALNENHLDFRSCLEIARALREQIDWGYVRATTQSSPFARAFFEISDGLGISSAS